MSTDAVQFVRKGMAPALAVEVARQIDDRLNTSTARLIGLGMAPALAVVTAYQISHATGFAPDLIGLGVPIELAATMVTAINAAPLLPGFSPNLDFQNQIYIGGTLASLLTFTRTGTGATNMLWTDPAGFTPTGYVANVVRIRSGTNNDGWLFEGGPKANYFKTSGVPVSQTVGGANPVLLLQTGAHSSWVNAEVGGSLTIVGDGDANITVTSVSNIATHGSPVFFTVNSLGATGSISATVAGTVHQAQIENTGFCTSYMPSTASNGARGNEVDTLTTLPTGASTGGGTYYFAGVPFDGQLAGPAATVCMQSDAGSTASRIATFRRQNAGTEVGRGVIDTTPDIGSFTWADYTAGKLIMSCAAGAQIVNFNAGTPATATNGLPSTGVTTMRIGKGTTASNDHWYGIIRQAAWSAAVLNGAQTTLATG